MKNYKYRRQAFSTSFFFLCLVAACLSVVAQGRAFAQGSQRGDAQTRAGEAIAHQGLPPSVPACASCHGAAGEGNAATGFPRLAGLPSGYLAEQLADFASGTRQHAVMSPVAKALPSEARADVAQYFASLPASTITGQKPPQPASTPDPMAMELALNGNWKEDVPACVSCHGDQGSGVGDHFPALAGQPAAYLRAQLGAWKNGTRSPGPLGLMGAIARRLSDKEADAVAGYFASLPPSEAGLSLPASHGAAR